VLPKGLRIGQAVLCPCFHAAWVFHIGTALPLLLDLCLQQLFINVKEMRIGTFVWHKQLRHCHKMSVHVTKHDLVTAGVDQQPKRPQHPLIAPLAHTWKFCYHNLQDCTCLELAE
jgi:hypothetical protein